MLEYSCGTQSNQSHNTMSTSGLGRDLDEAALENYTGNKFVAVKLARLCSYWEWKQINKIAKHIAFEDTYRYEWKKLTKGLDVVRLVAALLSKKYRQDRAAW